MATSEIGVEQEDGRWNDSSGAYMGDGKHILALNLELICDQICSSMILA